MLEPGASVEHSIAPGETHVYGIEAEAGQLVHVVLEPRHLDLVARILEDGNEVAPAEIVIDGVGPLLLSAVAKGAGPLRLEIRLRDANSKSGRYTVTLDPLRTAGAPDERRVTAERLQAQGNRMEAEGSVGALREALDCDQGALAIWREMDERRGEAAAWQRLGKVYQMSGDGARARDALERAVFLWRAEGDAQREAAALVRLSDAEAAFGGPARAAELLETALALGRSSGDASLEGHALYSLAAAWAQLGDLPRAVQTYEEAAVLLRKLGERTSEAYALDSRAACLTALGEPERALDDHSRVLALLLDVGDRRGAAATNYHMAAAYLGTGRAGEALDHASQALEQFREVGDKRFEAYALVEVGRAQIELRRPREAVVSFEQALAGFRASDTVQGIAMALMAVGFARLEAGDNAVALATLEEALPLVRATGNVWMGAFALVYLSRAERALDRLDGAREHIEEAVRLTESVRSAIPGAGSRSSYLASAHGRYGLLVDILMALHRDRPGEGLDLEALAASERGRARSLLEQLAEARADFRSDLEPRLLESEKRLGAALDEKARDEARLRGRKHTAEEAAAVRRNVETASTEYREAQEKIAAASPHWAALARPQPLTIPEIQAQVVDGGSLLLEYALGEERSWLWAVTPTSVTSHELPGRAVIEAAARRVRRGWSAAGDVGASEASRQARALGRMLLGPVADQLGRKRLVIVADGALQYLPFAALPEVRSGRPLVANHEIVSLPSASTLAVLRREAVHRMLPERTVAVLADPVFDARDSRVRGGPRGGASGSPLSGASPALVRSAHDAGLLSFERLAGSRREAERIAALAGPGESFLALDFDASRATAAGPELARSRIVHFASHALLDAFHPELSGIVLSLVDEKGRPRDGFLRAHEIYDLRLSADLVVLSACQTALGKEVRGEGLVGLVRGFMYAGAPRVLASLWRVPDRPTAELMGRFYRSLLVEKLPAAAALRAAQSALRAQKRWAAPYYWAAFTLQGDWN